MRKTRRERNERVKRNALGKMSQSSNGPVVYRGGGGKGRSCFIFSALRPGQTEKLNKKEEGEVRKEYRPETLVLRRKEFYVEERVVSWVIIYFFFSFIFLAVRRGSLITWYRCVEDATGEEGRVVLPYIAINLGNVADTVRKDN